MAEEIKNVAVEDSILNHIKKQLGIPADVTDFDLDIITHINTAFMILDQIGVRPTTTCYRITDENNTWSEFIGDNVKLEPIKSYIYMKVKTLFDPPTNGTLSQSMAEEINQIEWRLHNEWNFPREGESH